MYFDANAVGAARAATSTTRAKATGFILSPPSGVLTWRQDYYKAADQFPGGSESLVRRERKDTDMTSLDTPTRLIALYVLCLATQMIVLDTTIVNVELPPVRSDLGFS